jgi:hypothetical protein
VRGGRRGARAGPAADLARLRHRPGLAVRPARSRGRRAGAPPRRRRPLLAAGHGHGAGRADRQRRPGRGGRPPPGTAG